MNDPTLGPVLCLPCQWVLHDACMGAVTVCECFTELLIEAEEDQCDSSG